MKKLFALLLLGLACIAQAADNRPDVGRYVKEYRGSEGIRVYVTRIGPVDKGEVLLQITGIDHPWDGVIQKAKVRNVDSKRRYSISQNGQDYEVLLLDGESGSVHLPYQPDNLREYHVSFKDNTSGNAQHFLTQWEEQNSKR